MKRAERTAWSCASRNKRERPPGFGPIKKVPELFGKLRDFYFQAPFRNPPHRRRSGAAGCIDGVAGGFGSLSGRFPPVGALARVKNGAAGIDDHAGSAGIHAGRDGSMNVAVKGPDATPPESNAMAVNVRGTKKLKASAIR